jgi:hypothetical protein
MAGVPGGLLGQVDVDPAQGDLAHLEVRRGVVQGMGGGRRAGGRAGRLVPGEEMLDGVAGLEAELGVRVTASRYRSRKVSSTARSPALATSSSGNSGGSGPGAASMPGS